jgi:4-hydroxy-tetrahydrodipicolinate reductase
MSEPIRILVHGASGRMGGALLRLAPGFDGLRVVAATSRSRPPGLPSDVAWSTPGDAGALPAFDALIDFSLPDAFDAALALALDREVALVSGTTGLSEAQQRHLVDASQRIPIAWAANFSLGVAVLADLVARAARALEGWDCDIVESHHVHKQDAPSGTALALGARAREGGAEPRYASLRAGDIVGEHLVQFASAGERIELVHRASNRDIFARGALHVATRLPQRPPGMYAVRDLLD